MIKKYRTQIGVAVIILVHAVINFIWLKQDTFPLWFDYGGYFGRSIEIYHASQNSFIDFAKAILGIREYADAYLPYRVFLPISSVPWYYVFGIDADVAVMSCTIFLAIALFSTYAIAARIFNRMTGLLAAFILSISPGFFLFYRRYSPEFAATAMVALTVYLLLCSKNFQNRAYSILSAISFGLSMITKEMSFAFIFGIVIYSTYKAELFFIFKPGYLEKIKSRLINFIIFLSISAVAALLIYWLHGQKIIYEIFDVAYSHKMRQMYDMLNPYSVQGVTFYLRNMIDFSFLPFYFLFSLLGVYFCIRQKLANKGFVFVWFISSYLILSSTQTKAAEYAIPLLIPVSVITAYGMNGLFKNKINKILLIVLVVVWGIFNFLVYSFPIFSFSQKSTVRHNLYYPVNDNWNLNLEGIVDYIRDNVPDISSVSRVHVDANLYAFSPMTLGYIAEQKKAKLEFHGYNLPSEDALSCDFIIIKSGEKQGLFYSLQQAQDLRGIIEKDKGFIKLPERFMLPDQSVAEIYKKVH